MSYVGVSPPAIQKKLCSPKMYESYIVPWSAADNLRSWEFLRQDGFFLNLLWSSEWISPWRNRWSMGFATGLLRQLTLKSHPKIPSKKSSRGFAYRVFVWTASPWPPFGAKEGNQPFDTTNSAKVLWFAKACTWKGDWYIDTWWQVHSPMVVFDGHQTKSLIHDGTQRPI